MVSADQRNELAYWQKDSATAWDKCEEYRLEIERLNAIQAEFHNIEDVAKIRRLREALTDACHTVAVHGEQPPAKWLEALK